MTQAFVTEMVVTKRDGFKIFIDDTEKGRLDDLRKEFGMLQREVGTRLVRWLLAQPKEVQKAVIQGLGGGERLRIVIERQPLRVAAKDDQGGEPDKPKRK